MLTIVYQPEGCGLKDTYWVVGETKPYIPLNDIIRIEADKKELVRVCESFVNLPCVKVVNGKEYCTWRGEMAKFIFENLPDTL